MVLGERLQGWDQSEHERDPRDALPLLEYEETARKCCEQGSSSSLEINSQYLHLTCFTVKNTGRRAGVIYKLLSLWQFVVATTGLSMITIGLHVHVQDSL